MDSVGYSIVNRMSKVIVTALVVATFGLALLGTGRVHAQDNEPEPGSLPCAPFGQDGPGTIPEGTVIKVGSTYWQCHRGYWWKLPNGHVSPIAATTLSPDTTTTGGGKQLANGASHANTLEMSR